MSLGVLTFQVLSGTNVKLNQKEEYYILAQAPDSISKAGVLKTNLSSVQRGLDWNFSRDIVLTGHLMPEHKFQLQLFQKNAIRADTKIATCSVSLEVLSQGNSIESVDFSLMNASDSSDEYARVCLKLGWKDGCMPEGLMPEGEGGGLLGGGGDAPTAGGGGAPGAPGGAKKGGSKPLPDCKDQDFAVRVWFHKATNLQSLKEDGIYNPQGVVEVLGQKQRTETQKSTNEPVFNEEVTFQFQKVKETFWNEPLSISLSNSKFGPSETIGMLVMDMQAVYRANPQHFMQRKWFALNKSQTEGNVMGFIKVSIAVLNLRTDAFPEIDEDEDDDAGDEEAIQNLISGPGSVFEEVSLFCELIRAEGIPQMDAGVGGSADPYVKLIFGKRSVNTVHVRNTLTPVWNTHVMLPVRLPSLTSTILVQLWDYDATSADDINGTVSLSLNHLLECGEGGKPHLPAQWVNFYGHPRPNDADFNSYFKKMAKGEKKGIDYRGRMLMRMEGVQGHAIPSLPPITETKVELTIAVQLMQFSMIPDSGKYKIRVSMGTFDACTAPMETKNMQGSKMQCVYYGKTLEFKATFSVIAPEAEVDAAVVKQLPDLQFQIVEDGTVSKQLGALGAALNPLATGLNEAEPYASCRFPMRTVLSACTETGVFSKCKAMRLSADGDVIDEGRPPANPIAQLAAGVFISKCTPEHQNIPTSKGLQFWPASNIPSSTPGVPPPTPRQYILESCIYQAKEIPAGDSNGLSDPFVRISWANASAQSGTKLETLNPMYNEMVRVIADARDPFPDIVVEIWDWDFVGRDTFLCKMVIPFSKIGASAEVEPISWYDHFTDSFGNRSFGCGLLLSFRIMAATAATLEDVPDKMKMIKKIGKSDTYLGYPIPIDRALPTRKYVVDMTLFGLRHMRKFRLRNLQKPTVEVALAGYNIVVGKAVGANPDFNVKLQCVFELPVDPKYLPCMVFRVFDSRIGPRVLVGACAFNASSDLCNAAKKAADQAEHDKTVKDHMALLLEAKERMLDGLKPQKADTTVFIPLPEEPVKGKGPLKLGGLAQVFHAKKSFKEGAKPTSDDAPVAGQKDNLQAMGRDEGPLDAPLLDSKEDDPVPAGDGTELPATAGGGTSAAGGRPSTTTVEVKKKLTDAEIAEALNGAYNFTPEDVQRDLSPISDKSTEPDEELWFDRYDPEGLDSDLPAEICVARLGKLHVLDAGKTTCEDLFGPFNDQESEIEFSRGWGKKAVKAGKANVDVNLRPAEPHEKSLAITLDPKPKPLDDRKPVEFICRVYILNCRNLAAKDDSPLGKASDPYIIMRFTGNSDSKQERHVKCKDEGKFQTLSPDYFFMKEVRGNLPNHSSLTVTVFDYDKIGRDEEIGSTEIDLGRRWYSRRGYQHAVNATSTMPYPPLAPGSYTELRTLRNRGGQMQGQIELWVDMFPASSAVPRPIDITPPPPVELEIRATIWNARDVILVDNSTIGNEKMTDIYIRCWLDGMRSDMQNTDVHYRSLDGTGNFNWRMNFRAILEPRTKKIFATEDTGSSAKAKLASLFSIRKEHKKYHPFMHCQIFDNDLLPGTDDFIGEINVDLLAVNPTLKRRDQQSFMGMLATDMTTCCNCWPLRKCPCCKKNKQELSLQERQMLAFKEAREDEQAKRDEWSRVADDKIKVLKETQSYTPEQLVAIRKRLIKEQKKASTTNVLQDFLPQRRKKSQAHKPVEKTIKPQISETPKFWLPCRGPFGGGRVGDVQISFQIVEVEKITKDKDTFAAGKGRSEPQALPDPERPDSSFFWLSSPWKSAIHILWKNYKWYLFTIVCLALWGLLIYLFLTTGLETKVKIWFGESPAQATS